MRFVGLDFGLVWVWFWAWRVCFLALEFEL